MKKTVIAISGAGNLGKSNTVKRIAHLLMQQPGAMCTPSILDFDQDVKAIISRGTLTIGIESQDDPGLRQADSLNEFSRKGCDLIICACRAMGSTYDAVTLLKKNYTVIWATNYRGDSHHELLNQRSAEDIVKMMEMMAAQPDEKEMKVAVG